MYGTLLPILVFAPMAGAILSYIIGKYHKTARDIFADVLVAAEFAAAVYLYFSYSASGGWSYDIPYVAGLGLHFVMDGFRSIYAMIAAFMWLMTTIFSREYFKHYRNRNRYYLFLLLTLGATMGVFLAADLYTAFIFFEIMSFTSYVWVCHDEKKASLRAGETYLAVAVIGGMVMLMGLFLLYDSLGDLTISRLPALAADYGNKKRLYAAAICISTGYAAKAGAFPLHIWLPKAHPVAPAPASALLSGILTKAGIFGLLAVSCNLLPADVLWGSCILAIGCVTMFLGALLALFSVDLKRTLACSSVSQIGFILVGIGMQGLLGRHNETAAMGTLLHMVNHSLIKLTLFMAAGVVFMNTHKLNLNDIRGFGRKKHFLKFVFLMGALGIGGVPFWNGYISKTLLHESIVAYGELLEAGEAAASFLGAADIKSIEWVFLVSGGMTIAYMTKLFTAVFVEKNTDPALQEKYDNDRNYMNMESRFALLFSTLLLPAMGFWPDRTAAKLTARGLDFMRSETEPFMYYTFGNLKGALVSISIGIFLYFIVVRLLLMKKENGHRMYADRWCHRLDLENTVYRPAIATFCSIGRFFCRILDCLADTVVVFLRKTVYQDRPYPVELTEGTWLTDAMGRFLNAVQAYMEKHNPKWKHRHHDFVHELAMIHVELTENRIVLTRTLSFGLLMFCIGLIITVVYMLRVYW